MYDRELMARRGSVRRAQLEESPLFQEIIPETWALLAERLAFFEGPFTRLGVFSRSAPVRGGAQMSWLGDIPSSEVLPPVEEPLEVILSHLNLHQLNDIPSVLRQFYERLCPGGLVLGVFWGGESLSHLRRLLAIVEETRWGRVSPRVHPMIRLEDLAPLLKRVGFVEPVTDHERWLLEYEEVMDLLRDLKALGETNVLIQRMQGLTTPRFWSAVSSAAAATPGPFRETAELLFFCARKPRERK